MSVIIGICGGSCSGKTTLAKHLEARLGSDQCLLIRQDDYYFDMRTLKYEGDFPNFDHPSTIDFDQLVSDLKNLKRGDPVKPPRYDFNTHHRVVSDGYVAPKNFIIVEGLLILSHADLRAIFDHTYYLKCPDLMRLERRLRRDITDRGREEREIRWQFGAHVRPMHDKYVAPSQIHAQRIIKQAEYMEDIDRLCDSLIAKWTAA